MYNLDKERQIPAHGSLSNSGCDNSKNQVVCFKGNSVVCARLSTVRGRSIYVYSSLILCIALLNLVLFYFSWEISFLSCDCWLPPFLSSLCSPFLTSFLVCFLPFLFFPFLPLSFLQLWVTTIMLFLHISLIMHFLPHGTQQKWWYVSLPGSRTPHCPTLPCMLLETIKESVEHLAL